MTMPPPGALPAAGECHLWPAPVGAPASDSHLILLDPAEQAKAGQFKVDSARDVFLTSRTVQRLVLARYLGCPPAAVQIARDCAFCGAEHGRPYIRQAPIDFSVSHTRNWLLIAVVGDGRVGVDVETVNAAKNVEDLAGHVLSPAEQEEFLLVPRPERASTFLRAWTRKEATVKLTGHGLVAPLSHLNVSGSVAQASPPAPNWPADPIYLHDVPAASDVRAAIATTTPVTTIITCGPVPDL
jgi:4'-phosphopantetheinyl transferase